MADERGVLRRIVWRDVFPGLMLFRCFRLAIGLPCLFLATVGTLLMPLGPRLSEAIFPSSNQPIGGVPAITVADLPQAQMQVANPAASVFSALRLPLPNPRLGLLDSYLTLVRPFVQLFDRQASFGQMLGSLCVALWYLLVWCVCGGAITRIAVVRLGTGEQVTLQQSLRHVVVNLGWYFTSPLFPLLGVALVVVPLFFLGVLMHLSIGVLVAGILWPLVLLAGLGMAVLLVGLLFGWPLMWPTISAEEASDSFQAFSNSFSFTFQRPLQYLAYVAIALLVGGIGGLFVEGFADAVITLNQWAISLGLGRDRLNQVLSGQLDNSPMVWVGSGLIDMGDRLIHTIAEAFYFSFLFCTSSAIYLLLRREVDQTDFDEVYMPENAKQFSLPPLRSGPHGVPEIDEPRSNAPDRPSE